MDVLAAMQGNADGHGKGLTTYPDGDDEQRAAHAACLALEAEGKVTRHVDMETADEGVLADKNTVRHVIWMPIARAPHQAP